MAQDMHGGNREIGPQPNGGENRYWAASAR